MIMVLLIKIRLFEMSDSYTYARAMNEALANDGKAAKYSQNELNAFQKWQISLLLSQCQLVG